MYVAVQAFARQGRGVAIDWPEETIFRAERNDFRWPFRYEFHDPIPLSTAMHIGVGCAWDHSKAPSSSPNP
jgi:hypothetical protein